MRITRRFLGCLVPALMAFGVGAQTPVQVDFFATSVADERQAGEYEAIWAEYGEQIVASLEARTCLPFQESTVSAEVTEDVSNSGGPEHPMRLRASYSRKIKESTLVHELGHRHLWQLVKRFHDVDSHMTLFLVLDRVWADVWGKPFADERVSGEAEWEGEYADAWAWARSLTRQQRIGYWNRLLAMNGMPGGCPSLLDGSLG